MFGLLQRFIACLSSAENGIVTGCSRFYGTLSRCVMMNTFGILKTSCEL